MHAFWLVTFVFGVISSLIAASKGRHSFGWFMAGLFLGPFALIVVFLPPVEREGLYIRCPSCREVIIEDAQVCRYCHATFDHA